MSERLLYGVCGLAILTCARDAAMYELVMNRCNCDFVSLRLGRIDDARAEMQKARLDRAFVRDAGRVGCGGRI
ncbi:hypothetical protein [Caballeronia pedi]|uniref:hypothetical protein n=1 Tax=Caballeronia pedi TaxID=1777141 RepID=UPI001177F63D|nr:hypothetical protein [Caballeronia pedi]